MENSIIRNPDGTFAKGCVANPTGTGGDVPGWQKYGDRTQILMAKYTVVEIMDIVQNKRYNACSSMDYIALQHIARALEPELSRTDSGSSDIRGERTTLLDRIEGDTKKNIDVGGNLNLAVTTGIVDPGKT